jgi:hypothetical protein
MPTLSISVAGVETVRHFDSRMKNHVRLASFYIGPPAAGVLSLRVKRQSGCEQKPTRKNRSCKKRV